MFIMFADVVADCGESQTTKVIHISIIGMPMLPGQE